MRQGARSSSSSSRGGSGSGAARSDRLGSLRDFKPTLAHGLIAFLVIFGLVVMSLAVWAVFNVRKKPFENGGAKQFVLGQVQSDGKVVTPPAHEMEALVQAMLAARTPEALGGLVRKSEQDPAAMVAKLAKLEEVDGKLRRVKYIYPLRSRCVQIEAVLVDFVGGRNRLALLAPDADGKWKVDFDGFDRYGSPAWDTLLGGGAVDGKVRVNIANDRYYNGHFRDESKWVCYGMQSPDRQDSMFCYAPRDGTLHKALDAVIAAPVPGEIEEAGKRTMARRVILGIRHHADADKRQFEVTHVYSDDWAEGAKAMDEIIAQEEKQKPADGEPKPPESTPATGK